MIYCCPVTSALSSRILITNRLITFLTLHSRYPVLQPINTYYSLIGAVYVFRVCALFCPRIASSLLYWYYPHVLSISRNCFAPPHFPESPHRTLIPQCVYIVHTVRSLLARSLILFAFCLFSACILSVHSEYILSSLVLCISLLPCNLYQSGLVLVPVSRHLFPVDSSDSLSLVKCCFESVLLSVFCTVLPLISWLMNPCVSTSLLPCPIKPGFRHIVHLGPSFTFTPHHCTLH